MGLPSNKRYYDMCTLAFIEFIHKKKIEKEKGKKSMYPNTHYHKTFGVTQIF